MPVLELPGRSIEFADRGRGEPVILLHCSGGSGAQWRALAEALAPEMRTLAPDLHGYGRSGGWPGEPRDFRLADEAAAVLALLARLDEPAHLVGHSYGGAVALHVAHRRPQAVRSLAVIEPVALHLLAQDPADAATLHEIRAVADDVRAALAAGALEAGYARFVDYWSGPGAWNALPASKRDALAALLPKVALDFQAVFGDPAGLADFRALELPALVLQGGDTRAPVRRICERLAATLPDVRRKVIAGAGHMLPLTHRAEVEALLLAHLRAHARGRTADALLATA
jgi:pimeloyl-ACP methyl ester carboxylesterase